MKHMTNKQGRPVHVSWLTSLLFAVIGGFAASAQQFDSGSTGADGDLVLTDENVGHPVQIDIPLPPDGIFHFKSVYIKNHYIRFIKNAANTPVHILCQGDVTILNTEINMDAQPWPNQALPGEPGPGGFAGGRGGLSEQNGGAGLGPGGGAGSRGSGIAGDGTPPIPPGHGTFSGNKFLIPLIGGSGGGGGYGAGSLASGGGGGGGAILIASNNRINMEASSIHATFGAGAGYGSGGAIRLAAPVVTGHGELRAFVGGTIRIDCLDREAWKTITILDANFTTFSRGANMVVFPANNPKLEIVRAAGQAVLNPVNGVVRMALDPEAETTQTIVLRGRGFTGSVPITINVVPENGEANRFTGQLDMGGQSEAEVSIPIQLSKGQTSTIQAWAR